jgi:catechol 2,3-dioxygenase-like lactoylglutathione lyase family enzyme
MRVASVVVGAPDPRALAAFYERLLDWVVVASYGPRPGHPAHDAWVMLRPETALGVETVPRPDPAQPTPGQLAGLAFQYEPQFRPPVWPPTAGEPQMLLHLDIAVEDLEAATEFAVSIGARLADHQPQERVRVLLDPAGHPFCLFPGAV